MAASAAGGAGKAGAAKGDGSGSGGTSAAASGGGDGGRVQAGVDGKGKGKPRRRSSIVKNKRHFRASVYEGKVEMEGYLEKRSTGLYQRWQRRFFSIRGNYLKVRACPLLCLIPSRTAVSFTLL